MGGGGRGAMAIFNLWMATYRSTLGIAYSCSCWSLFSVPPFAALRPPFTLMVSQTTPVPYEIFRSASTVLDAYGGPWLFDRHWPMTAVFMGWDTSYEVWCEGTCIHAYSRGTCKSCESAFSLLVNITVEMNDYPGATNLAYNWGYSPALCDSLGVTGERGEIRLSIGDQIISDVISSVPCPNSINRYSPGWSGSSVNHSGNTALLRFRSEGFIPINITFLKTAYTEDKNLTWYFRGIHFEITTPTGGNTLPPSRRSNATVIVISMLVPAVIALVILLVFFLWRKHRKNFQKPVLNISHDGKNRPSIDNNSSVSPFQISTGAGSSAMKSEFYSSLTALTQSQMYSRQSMDPNTNFPSSPASTSTFSGQSPYIIPTNVGNGGDKLHPQNPGAPSVFFGTATLPPTHTNPHSSQYKEVFRSVKTLLTREGPNLAEFAKLNRDLIPEKLESKLMRAGYIPSDGPNIFTEDEWRDRYGVSRLEVARVEGLNARWKAATMISREESWS